jgi:hypothetical protein
MLPMLYFPHQGQVISSPFDPPLPSPTETEVWRRASEAAFEFWDQASSHPEISKAFKTITKTNAAKVRSMALLGAYLP